MLVIGLCGGSGSGKSTVSELFAEYGVPTISADLVYHELTDSPSECLEELIARFGKEILNEKGTLDRKKLASIVFSAGGEEDLKELNEISHRHVLKRMREKIGAYREEGKIAVLADAPLLFESGFDRECGEIVAVLAKKEVRIARIRARDGLSEEEAVRRISHQLSDEFLISRADDLLRNDGDLAALREAVSELYEKIKSEYKEEKNHG